MNVRVSIAALAVVAGACFLAAAELPCASAESMDGLMQAWTAGFNARQPGVTARVTLRAKFSADFVDPLARGEIKVAPFAREWFPAELARFSGNGTASPGGYIRPLGGSRNDTSMVISGSICVFVWAWRSTLLYRVIN